jgi:hypothetical protein
MPAIPTECIGIKVNSTPKNMPQNCLLHKILFITKLVKRGYHSIMPVIIPKTAPILKTK